MLIIAYFSNKGVPATGLTPRINIWRDSGVLLINSALMTEIAGGFYKYDFTTYDDSLNYVFRADGGTILLNEDRYAFGSNEAGQVTSGISLIPDRVWDESTAGHNLTNSFAELVKRISGLCQDNYAVLNPTHDKFNNLTSGIIRIYPTAADVDNDTNAIASFQINAAYNSKGQLTSYKVKRL
jgi:hypothetical protein